jgi:hypothetical protein
MQRALRPIVQVSSLKSFVEDFFFMEAHNNIAQIC